jgi:hypothetical protein
MPTVTSDNLQNFINDNLMQKQIAANSQKIRDLDKYKTLTSDNKKLEVNYQPLNFDLLHQKGAFRVTHKGMDETYDPDPKAGFSLVSAYNDAVGTQTRGWKNNPVAYDVVKNMFENNPQNIGPHKYMQIVESAKDLGLSPEQIFMLPTK